VGNQCWHYDGVFACGCLRRLVAAATHIHRPPRMIGRDLGRAAHPGLMTSQAIVATLKRMRYVWGSSALRRWLGLRCRAFAEGRCGGRCHFAARLVAGFARVTCAPLMIGRIPGRTCNPGRVAEEAIAIIIKRVRDCRRCRLLLRRMRVHRTPRQQEQKRAARDNQKQRPQEQFLHL
jgi:hypothetical protein